LLGRHNMFAPDRRSWLCRRHSLTGMWSTCPRYTLTKSHSADCIL
jgi:hypothetical protein